MTSGRLVKRLAFMAVAALLMAALVFVPPPTTGYGRNGGRPSASRLMEAERTITPPPASPDEGVSRWTELQARLDKMTAVSQNSDIQRRGQWQKRQIEHYCQKYDLDKLQNKLPSQKRRDGFIRKKLYRHLIFDDKKRVLFCFIPKVGCTNMRKFFFLSQGLIPETVLSVDNADSKQHAQLELSYLEPAINKATFAKVNMTDRQRLWRVRSYYKFTFVRNPLDRLLSAYLDKIAPPMQYTRSMKNRTNPQLYQSEIASRYRKADYMKWRMTKGKFKIRITFADYIHWVIDSDQVVIDEHYAPLIANAQPCRMRYHFYGNFKLYDSEMGHLIKKLDANPKYFESVSYHKSGNKTEDLVQQYYSQLPEDLRQQLFHKFYQELDFYYHLYPEDSLSHVHTLGVQEEIPVHCSDCSTE